MNKTEELITVKNVFFSYDQKPVLIDINLSIWAGDFLAILGPNGAGKTTLIKIILGLLRVQRGQVMLFNQPIESFKDWHKLGYVPQTATYFDPLFPATVQEVMAMALFSIKKVWIKRKAEKEAMAKFLELVGLKGKEKVPIGQLSTGEQQKVFIARALIHQPKVLILDEPTTGIDAETQRQFYDLLHQLNVEKKITIIIVTHDIGIVNRHITRVACLEGRLIYHGSHDDFCRSKVFKEMVGRDDHVISHQH
ncbi:MAG: metal ABC transporter ATP-binding protein [Candidatus Aminicenantes bacterium]|nr:metal ABC transporter ATP-binding protein [Candidatus Aminicenantes bacterium]